jgi:uncharacterized protein (TIGR02145 family)
MKRAILSVLMFSACFILTSQIPQGFNYQAVARTSGGSPISNITLQVKVGILSKIDPVDIVWEELHSSVTTDAGGVFNLVIGSGIKQSGSASSFNAIDWTKTPKYLRIQIYYQNSWLTMGNASLWSVPYSMVAGGLSSNITKLSVKGETTNMEEALFEVKNKDGQTVFAVYNEGVRIYVSDGSKGAKGGFAVGGFGTDKAGESTKYLFVNKDSVRIYLDTNPLTKGAKGGFAVGGYDLSKGSGPVQDYLKVSPDSIRMYIDGQVKGMKGGFAVGGFNNSKNLPDNFMLINPDSTRFYVRQFGPGSSSTFGIVGIGLDQSQTSLLNANPDTVGIAGVLNVQNNLQVNGNINYTGQVNLIAPEIQTLQPVNVTANSAIFGGMILNTGGSVVIVSGICWSTSPNPTVKLATKTTDGSTTEQFTSTITGLAPNTTYYVRAYATNANGTGYGNEIIISTLLAGNKVTDYDGNNYNVVYIGTQTWLASNLRATHLNDGTAIPNVTDDGDWMNLSTTGYSWYNNDQVTYADYGPLYNWATVNTGLLCPTGWHVPSETEGNSMLTYLGGGFVAGGSLKEAGFTHWLTPNTGATNSTGFTALPGGMRNASGPFISVGENAFFWSSSRLSTDPSFAILFYSVSEMFYQTMLQNAGMSVRCIKN